MRDDLFSQTINRIAAQGGYVPILLVAAIASVLGFVLVSFRPMLRLGVVIAGLALTAAWLALLAVLLAQYKEPGSDPRITVIRDYYGDYVVRQAASIGMVLIPAIAATFGITVWKLVQRRRRAQLPTYLKQGLKAFFQRDLETALKEYTTAINLDRSRAESYNRRGQVHFQMGNLDQAVKDFDRALDLDPELPSAYRHRGMVFAARDDLDLALNDFDFALKLDVSDCASLLQRGLCLARLGRNDKAIAELRRVLQLTNHSDYAEPAIEQLKRLGAVD